MFTLRWSIHGICEAVCGKSKDAWEVYWALKKSVEKIAPPSADYWIEIYSNGVACNPERGSDLPCCREEEGPVFVLRKAEKA